MNDIENKIKDFLKSGDENFLEFISKLNPASAIQIIENSKQAKDIKEILPKRIFLKNGIYHRVFKVDVKAFSFSLMKLYAADRKLKEMIEILDKIETKTEEENYRLKKLRINLFLNLSYAFSGYFDAELYKKISLRMVKIMNLIGRTIKEDKKAIINCFTDSYLFLVKNKEEGQKTLEKINNALPEGVEVRGEFYPKVVKYFNIIDYVKEDGSFLRKRTTRTPPKYENLKEQVVDCLREGRFADGIKAVKENTEVALKKKNDYLKNLMEVIRDAE